eukprot:2843918-Prymnesium_polylepis.1
MDCGHDGVGALYHLVQLMQATTGVSSWVQVLGLAALALRSDVAPPIALSQALVEIQRRAAERALVQVTAAAARQQQQLQQAALLLPDGIAAGAADSLPISPANPARQLAASLAAAGATTESQTVGAGAAASSCAAGAGAAASSCASAAGPTGAGSCRHPQSPGRSEPGTP